MRCLWKGERSSFQGNVVIWLCMAKMSRRIGEKTKVIKVPTFTALAGVSNLLQLLRDFLALLRLKILFLLPPLVQKRSTLLITFSSMLIFVLLGTPLTNVE